MTLRRGSKLKIVAKTMTSIERSLHVRGEVRSIISIPS